jgi:hypothetical protein
MNLKKVGRIVPGSVNILRKCEIAKLRNCSNIHNKNNKKIERVFEKGAPQKIACLGLGPKLFIYYSYTSTYLNLWDHRGIIKI